MNVQAAKYLEPVREINTLALENVEKLLNIQLKSINDTARLGVEQMKAAADIKDVDGLKKYFTEQAEVVKSLGERLVQDGQSALELGVSYTDKVQQVVNDTLKQEAPITATAARTAAKSK